MAPLCPIARSGEKFLLHPLNLPEAVHTFEEQATIRFPFASDFLGCPLGAHQDEIGRYGTSREWKVRKCVRTA